jgi:hypothetical protein
LRYYVHTNAAGIDPNQVLGVWQADQSSAMRIDVTESDLGRYKAQPGKSGIETLRSSFLGAIFDELELEPGELYPDGDMPDPRRRRLPERRDLESILAGRSSRSRGGLVP